MASELNVGTHFWREVEGAGEGADERESGGDSAPFNLVVDMKACHCARSSALRQMARQSAAALLLRSFGFQAGDVKQSDRE